MPLKNIRLFSGILYLRKTELTAKLQSTVYGIVILLTNIIIIMYLTRPYIKSPFLYNFYFMFLFMKILQLFYLQNLSLFKNFGLSKLNINNRILCYLVNMTLNHVVYRIKYYNKILCMDLNLNLADIIDLSRRCRHVPVYKEVLL